MFGQINTILSLHLEILPALRTAHARGAVHEPFIQFAHDLRCYEDFVKLFDSALLVYAQLIEKKREFRRFVEKVKASHGLLLNSLLITPIQRIAKYPLLLDNLLSLTPPDSPHFADVARARALIAETTNHVNETKRAHEKWQKVRDLELRISSLPGKLVKKGRCYLFETKAKNGRVMFSVETNKRQCTSICLMICCFGLRKRSNSKAKRTSNLCLWCLIRLRLRLLPLPNDRLWCP
eukprot:GABV01000705.1.p1 GENE.GABV01000705.1~~GABV01000705.1.p1  ORF type:complete len:262 (+),score=73.89 GABV01000705.1:81-788(+)